MFTEDCEGEIEIVDMLPFSADVHPALISMVMERGVVGTVKGGDQGELAAYTFSTPYLTAIVVENKVSVCFCTFPSTCWVPTMNN